MSAFGITCSASTDLRNLPRSRFSPWRGFMALGSQPRWTVRSADAGVGIDVGLRDYMLRVYRSEESPSLSLLSLEGVYGFRFAAPLDGAVGGRRGRHRCRPSGLHAPRLQLHGVGARAHRYRGLCRGVFGLLRVDREDTAALAGHSGAARPRDADELWRAADAGEHIAARLLDLCRADGLVARHGVPGLYRGERRARVLHHRRHLRRDEPLRLYDAARPVAVRLIFVYGADRHHHRLAGQYVPRLLGAAVRDLGDRRPRLHRPDRVGYAADQGDVLRGRRT